MGRVAARNILRALDGRPGLPFRYRDYGALATIGRNAAVVQLELPGGRRLSFWGWAAWLFWLFAHVYFLIGYRNRLVVLIDWAWSYWTFARHARVVAEAEAPPRTGSRADAPAPANAATAHADPVPRVAAPRAAARPDA
jgi:NADH dehydrogenase